MISNNTASGLGGGVWNDVGATLIVNNSTFTGNKALGSLAFSYPAAGYPLGSGSTEEGAIDNEGTAYVSGESVHRQPGPGRSPAATARAATPRAAPWPPTAGSPSRTVPSVATRPRPATAARGRRGKDGGTGGQGAGGAVNVDVAGNLADVSDCVFTGNDAVGGKGGPGSAGHDGGGGGTGAGGGVSMADATLFLADSLFIGNQAVGGVGGKGGDNGNGGGGGTGRGEPTFTPSPSALPPRSRNCTT